MKVKDTLVHHSTRSTTFHNFCCCCPVIMNYSRVRRLSVALVYKYIFQNINISINFFCSCCYRIYNAQTCIWAGLEQVVKQCHEIFISQTFTLLKTTSGLHESSMVATSCQKKCFVFGVHYALLFLSVMYRNFLPPLLSLSVSCLDTPRIRHFFHSTERRLLLCNTIFCVGTMRKFFIWEGKYNLDVKCCLSASSLHTSRCYDTYTFPNALFDVCAVEKQCIARDTKSDTTGKKWDKWNMLPVSRTK